MKQAYWRLKSSRSTTSGSSSTMRMVLGIGRLMPDIAAFVKINHFFGDVDGVVADPFEAVGDADQVHKALEVTDYAPSSHVSVRTECGGSSRSA